MLLLRSCSVLSHRIICLAGGFTIALNCSAGGFRTGTGLTTITPPVGTPLAGYYHERQSDGAHDPLYAKAAVLDDGKTKAAIVVCDLISMPRRVVQEARRTIEEGTGIPGRNVLIAATHSHTGPVLMGDSILDDFTGATNEVSREYLDRLPRLIAQSVIVAAQKLEPARVSYGSESEEKLAFNRRFWMADGTVGWNPGKLNRRALRAIGPIDPEVGVVYFEGLSGQPLLTFVNFAMHPDTVGGTFFSADYPGALARRLAEYRGPGMLTLFANGACGNLNHVNIGWAAPQTSTNEANRLGTILAAAVLKCYMHLEANTNPVIGISSRLVELALPPVSGDDLNRAKAILDKGQAATFMERVEAYKIMDVQSRKGRAYEVEVQAITLGRDLAWVSMPGELFVEPGLNLKMGSPFRKTHIIELANGTIGYLPNRSAYAEGNYEVVSARCAAGSAEKLITAALEILTELYAGKR